MHTAPLTQPAATRDLHYDPVTIALHWISAMLIGLLWVLGQTINFAPSGPLRVDYRSLHMLLGIALAGVFTVCFIWRLSRGRSLPGADNGLMEGVARLTHWTLYLLILVALVLGLANVWVRGDVVFNLFTVPAFDPANKALRHLIGDWHALAANAILILAGVHAAAALFHHFILRDGVLRRMLPMV
jgi:cytochrome b561